MLRENVRWTGYVSCAHAQLLYLYPTLAIAWTLARQAAPFMGFSQARILEWVAISSSGDPPNPGRLHLLSLLLCRWILYP